MVALQCVPEKARPETNDDFDAIDIRGVDYVSLKDKRKNGPQTFIGIMIDGFPDEPTAAASTEWTRHVIAASEGLLFTEVDSSMTGMNRNFEGKRVRRIMRYSGGHPKFRERCEAVAADGYRELALA